jgi:pimeloyl-ACP methyl ester carboxylesterase
MYYEIEGAGAPMVYLPMGFGVAGAPDLSDLTRRRMLISPDLQGRGRTADIDRPLTFAQQADDVAALLDHLAIERADFLGECVGGIVATLVAIRHPERVGRVITYGTAFGSFPDFLPAGNSGAPDESDARFGGASISARKLWACGS